MVMQISTSTPSAVPGSVSGQAPEHAAFRQLAQALKAGDIDSAKEAYASMVRNAPDGATWNPDSPFAELGRKLLAGDVEGAKSVLTSMVKDRIQHHERDAPVTPPVMPPVTAPTTSSTGGTAGGLLSVTA